MGYLRDHENHPIPESQNMPRTALILGANGRMGHYASIALTAHGWTVKTYRRGGEPLADAAAGVDLIFNGWNMAYADWAKTIPGLTAQVIEAAKSSGAAVMIPGNVYVFGQDLPTVLTPDTPHRATNPLGRVRIEMEAAYRASGVKTVILRAGDFLEERASGNWFDRIIAARIANGRISYPGPLDRMHAWAYLPDLAEAFAGLADRLDTLPEFTDLTFPGYAMTGAELSAACEAALGRSISTGRMSWLPIRIARPFWREAKHILEMRYLWACPHRLDGAALDAWLPDRPRTPVSEVMDKALAAISG
jgi:nucleoside-diphosphate-sugar epimerase